MKPAAPQGIRVPLERITNDRPDKKSERPHREEQYGGRLHRPQGQPADEKKENAQDRPGDEIAAPASLFKGSAIQEIKENTSSEIEAGELAEEERRRDEEPANEGLARVGNGPFHQDGRGEHGEKQSVNMRGGAGDLYETDAAGDQRRQNGRGGIPIASEERDECDA
jgi:hypothetical protein